MNEIERAAEARDLYVHSYVVTVVPASVTHHGEAVVISDAKGFDGQHFSSTYPTDDIAENVAHAVAAVLFGQGLRVRIVGCSCCDDEVKDGGR